MRTIGNNAILPWVKCTQHYFTLFIHIIKMAPPPRQYPQQTDKEVRTEISFTGVSTGWRTYRIPP